MVVAAVVMVAWYALPWTVGTAAAGGTVAGGWAAIGGMAGLKTIALHALSAVAISAVAGKLMSKGTAASGDNFSAGAKIAHRGSVEPRKIIYGECRVGGVITQVATQDHKNRKLCMFVVLSGHPIHSLEKIRLNDVDATLVDDDGATVSGETVYTVSNTRFTNTDGQNFGSGRLIRYTFHDGTQTAHDGLARASNGSSEVPDTHVFKDCAYVYIEMMYNPEALNQMPALSFQVKGKKVYDPRSFEFNANTAVNTGDNEITYKASSGASPDLSTNDSFVYDTNGGTAIGGLTNGTTYYVIKEDATTIKLATTAANANAGTAIGLTSKPSSETQKFTVSTFSSNSALCARDYLTDSTYGVKATDGEINDSTSGGGFAQAANVCDQDVTLADNSTTEKRYTANGFTNFSASGSGVLEAILSSCAGTITYTNGQFNCFPAAAQTASLTITDDDLLEPVSVVNASSRNDLFNGVKGIYVDSTNSWQAADTPVYVDVGSGSIASPQSGSYLSDDTPSGESTANYQKILEVQHPFTTTHTTSQRLAKIALHNQRFNSTMVCLVGLNFMKLQPKDWVQVTNSRLSYTNKLFEVMDMSLDVISSGDSDVPYLAVRLSLKETAASITAFTYNEHVAPLATASDLSTGDLSVAAPTNLALAATTTVEGATTKAQILVTWTNDDDDGVLGTEISWSAPDAASSFQSGAVGKGTARFIIPNLLVSDQGVTAKNYIVKIRHFSYKNVYSAYTSTANTNTALPSAPSAPTSLAASTDKPLITNLSWVNPSNTNLRAVKIHRKTSSSVPSNTTDDLVATLAGEPGKKMQWTTGKDDGLTAATNYYYWVSSINHSGTESAFHPSGTGVTGAFQKVPAGDMNVGTLSAISADMGSLTAGTIELDGAGWVKGGQSAYNNGTGYFLGYEGGYKFSIGSPTGNRLTWDGTTMTVVGDLKVGEYIAHASISVGAAVTERSHTSTSYASYKQFTSDRDGTVRVSYAYKVADSEDANSAVRVTVNDVTQNTLSFGTTASYTTNTVDVTVSEGDEIEILLLSGETSFAATATVYVKDVYLYADVAVRGSATVDVN